MSLGTGSTLSILCIWVVPQIFIKNSDGAQNTCLGSVTWLRVLSQPTQASWYLNKSQRLFFHPQQSAGDDAIFSFSQPGPRKESPGQDDPQPCKLSTIPEIFPQVEFVSLGDHQGDVLTEATLAGFDALVQKVLMGLSSRNPLYIADHPDHRTLINGLQDMATARIRKWMTSQLGRLKFSDGFFTPPSPLLDLTRGFYSTLCTSQGSGSWTLMCTLAILDLLYT